MAIDKDIWESQSQTSEPSKYLSQIKKLLFILAESRQATVAVSTYTVYSKGLESYRIEDIETAIAYFAQQERREGDTAFPSLGSLVGQVKASKQHRTEAFKQEQYNRERQHYLDNPHLYVSMKEITDAVNDRMRHRKVGESIPFEKTAAELWRQEDTNRCLEKLRRRPL